MLRKIDNACIAAFIAARNAQVCQSWADYEHTPAALIHACVWESNRQYQMMHDQYHGKRAPRSDELRRLRTAYLTVYAGIKEALHNG